MNLKSFINYVFLATCMLLSSLTQANVWSDSYTLESQGKYTEAADLLIPKTQNSVKNEFATMRVAWLNYLAKNYQSSIEFYKKAISFNPDSLDARLGIMLPLMAEGRWRGATVYGEQVLSVAPWQYYAHIRIMACKAAQQLWSSLEKHAESTHAHYPSDADTLIFLARAKDKLNKKNEAVKAYKKVLEIVPNNTESLQYIVNSME